MTADSMTADSMTVDSMTADSMTASKQLRTPIQKFVLKFTDFKSKTLKSSLIIKCIFFPMTIEYYTDTSYHYYI